MIYVHLMNWFLFDTVKYVTKTKHIKPRFVCLYHRRAVTCRFVTRFQHMWSRGLDGMGITAMSALLNIILQGNAIPCRRVNNGPRRVSKYQWWFDSCPQVVRRAENGTVNRWSIAGRSVAGRPKNGMYRTGICKICSTYWFGNSETIFIYHESFLRTLSLSPSSDLFSVLTDPTETAELGNWKLKMLTGMLQKRQTVRAPERCGSTVQVWNSRNQGISVRLRSRYWQQ